MGFFGGGVIWVFFVGFFVVFFLHRKPAEIKLLILLQVNKTYEAYFWLALHVGSSETKSYFLFLTFREQMIFVQFVLSTCYSYVSNILLICEKTLVEFHVCKIIASSFFFFSPPLRKLVWNVFLKTSIYSGLIMCNELCAHAEFSNLSVTLQKCWLLAKEHSHGH